MNNSGIHDVDFEPTINIQARICPICVDDHTDMRECTISDLKLRIMSLIEENKSLRLLLADQVERSKKVVAITGVKR